MEFGYCTLEKTPLEETGFAHTMKLIGGKYKIVILYCLLKAEVLRYTQIKKVLKNISHKTLVNTLKELESDGLIIRTEYEERPLRVEYSLSEKGESLMPVLNLMCDWGRTVREKES